MLWGSTFSGQLLCCIFCCLSFTITKTQPISDENFTVKEGLSENIVHCLLQDKKGFIWIGTHEGLNRYDGYGFKKFLFNKNDSTSLPNSPIESLYEDGEYNLLVRTTSGFTKMNTATGKFALVKNSITDLVSIVNQFFGPRRDIGIYNFGIDPFWTFRKQSNPAEVLRSTLKRDLLSYSGSLGFYYDDLKRLWVLKPDRLLVVDANGNEKTILTEFLIDYKDKKVFNWFIPDANGNIWLRASGKLFCIDKKTLLVKVIIDQSQLKGLAIENISTLLLDKSGVLWVGSFYGLKKLNLTPQKIKHVIHNEKGLVSNFVLGLNLYSENRLTVQHYFLDSFYTEIELPIMKVRQHRIENRSVEKLLNEVLIRNSNRADPVARNNQIQKLRNSNYDWKMFRYAHTDREGTIWSFYNTGRLINFNDTRSVGYEGTASHLWDDDKFLWIATAKQGLIRYHKHTGEIKNYKTDKNNSVSISTNEVICLLPDAKENLWIGTRGGGLNYFDKEKEIFTTYTQTNGLSNNTIYCMVMDDKNNLWMGTANGLSCFNNGSKTFQNFYTSDGLINTEFNRWSAIKDTQGNLYFGGMHGIDYFDPADVLLQQTNIPTVQLTDFKVGNRSLPIEPETILQHKDNFIGFEFAAMDFRNPSATKYEYMLEGANTDWIKADQNRTVTFTSLSPGKYTFKVKCSTQNGQWSNEAILPFTIKTPWWQTKWFYALCLLFVAAVLYSIYRFRIEQLRKLYSVRSKISQDLHDEIGATLSSIHVYSSVAAKVMGKDEAKAMEALQHINQNTRQVMENMSDIVWAINANDVGETTLAAKLKNYGYELLTPLNIQCVYWIDKEAEKKLTSMEARKNILLIAKEAMNNIAKYSNATEAMLRLECIEKNLQLEITDNGKGIDAGSNRSGNGLSNMKKRAEALGGEFRLVTEKEKGISILCRIPLANISD